MSQGVFSDRCGLLCSTIPNNGVCAMRRVTKLDFDFFLYFQVFVFDTMEIDRNENNYQDSFQTIAVHANDSCKQKCFLFSAVHHGCLQTTKPRNHETKQRNSETK